MPKPHVPFTTDVTPAAENGAIRRLQIVTLRDLDKMTFVAIGKRFKVTPVRVREMYFRGRRETSVIAITLKNLRFINFR